MAGAMLDIAVDDSAAGQALAELAQRIGDLTTPLNDIAEYLHQSHAERFGRKVAPDGSPWAPLSPVTIARKGNDNILRGSTGLLLDTLRHQVSNNELALGTDRPYGAVQQFGQGRGKSGTTKRGAPIPWGDIPARPYLGLSSEDDAEVLAIVSGYLMEPISATA